MPSFSPWLDARIREKFELEQAELARAAAQRRSEHEAKQKELTKLRQEQEAQHQKARAQAEARARARAAEEAKRNAGPQPASDLVELDRIPRSRLTAQDYIDEFTALLQGGADAEAVVASGEVLTVRVPKPGSGSTKIVWQFHTLQRDIQFGVDFEAKHADGTIHTETVQATTLINAHLEVVTGAHVAQGEGTWLLKFDNSYSYFRSKTVLYRVVCKNM